MVTTPVATLVSAAAAPNRAGALNHHLGRTTLAASPAGLVVHGGLRLDTDAHQVFVDGAEVHLTPTEFTLLAVLLSAPGTVLAKARLVGHLWGGTYAVSDVVADRRSLEVHMANLRRKLGDEAARPRFIETVRSVGYRILPAR
jgi:DNA-binding response OmpR family regulator